MYVHYGVKGKSVYISLLHLWSWIFVCVCVCVHMCLDVQLAKMWK